MTDITTISRMLADRAQSVVEHLLPGGIREGQEWRVGSTGGEKGKSLGVHLTGNKAGVWRDFASDEKGDLLDLWCATRGLGLPAALDEARAWLGVERPQAYREPRRTYQRPEKPDCAKPKDAVRLFLTEGRNIPYAAIEAYKVGEAGRWMVFPYLRDGELVMTKHECVDLDAAGKKQVRSSAQTEDCLWGWHVLPDSARELLITEGEKDALSWFAYGRPALSVPRGGGKGDKQKWIESDFDRLDRFERIYISTDMDEQGEEAAEEIAGRLGRHRCLRVKLPMKDANECLMAGVTQAEMDSAIANAVNLDPAGLRRPSEYGDRVAKLFWPETSERRGYSLPYQKLRGKLFFQPGDLTLWSGASGAGKSQVLLDSIPNWIKERGRICLASFEMPPAQSLRRLVKQTGNVDRPTRQYLDAILGFLDEGLLIYEKVGKSGVEPLLQIFDYARAKYGCDIFIVDSLLRLGIPSDDYSAQEKAMFTLVDWTVKHSAHTHLVAHARKGEKGGGPPELEDVKGASEIAANAANVLTFWRNRAHEDRVAAAKTDEELAELNEKPGVVMNVAKQRHGDFEGKIGLWFDQKTYRYHSSWDQSIWGRTYVGGAAEPVMGEPIEGSMF